ncbi:MAG: hypothetical protein B7C24_04125 [Bacteroidetes bacterium 4572_77]|nr:MAG: hypothetical protein B7C24_04125 [Bacteroidetes bacterium 4572_77]
MLFGKKSGKDNYKFKELKTYAWDREIGGLKKYRRVFEVEELNYLSVEFSIYNKRFDEENWEAKITLVLNKIEGSNKSQLTKDAGEYEWEAFIGGDLIAQTTFYIQNEGLVSTKINPYFHAESLQTYETPKEGVNKGERVYLKTFDASVTRYISGELVFTNLVKEEWYCELFFNIYDDTGMLIGSSDSFHLITPEGDDPETYTIVSGWGREDAKMWIHDNYTMEVIFMDTLVGIVPFKVRDKVEERIGVYEAYLNDEVDMMNSENVHLAKPNSSDDDNDVISSIENPDLQQDDPAKKDATAENDKEVKDEILIGDKPLEEILADLNALVGLTNIKEKVKEYVDYISFLQVREEAGIKEEDKINLHSVFTGNPGTGKTTVVKLLGQIYKSMGLLSKGHVNTVEASDLITGYVRQSGDMTKKAIEKARGGILFIDEAYMLFKEDSSGDFGPEAIAALITEMSDGKGDIAIMVAGYPKEMEAFLKSNPGLKSRFRNYFHFEDYTPSELLKIAHFAAKKKAVEIAESAEKRILKLLTDAYRKRDLTFGNARFCHALIDEAKINLGIRIMKVIDFDKPDIKQLSTLVAQDIEDVNADLIKPVVQLEIDEMLLEEALKELNVLIGLDSLKQEIKELVKLSRYYKEIDRNILSAFSMHTVFTGNPGTGKTTVARIVAKIYKALGLLERGHLHDVDGSDLVAGYVGQSAIKTKELIKKSMGGVLFIDEAYAITEGHNSGFGQKAIAALIKEMEDHRGKFALIVAGYPDNMKRFMETNPGFKSRFDQEFTFEDFTKEELWQVAESMWSASSFVVDAKAEKHIKAYIDYLHQNRDKYFGNARSIRKIVEQSIRNQELRMADMSAKKRTKKAITTITIKDVHFITGRTQRKERNNKISLCFLVPAWHCRRQAFES